LGELLYLDAVDYGIRRCNARAGPAGDGISNPPSERIVANLRALGHTVRVDPEALRRSQLLHSLIAERKAFGVGKAAGCSALATCIISCPVGWLGHPQATG